MCLCSSYRVAPSLYLYKWCRTLAVSLPSADDAVNEKLCDCHERFDIKTQNPSHFNNHKCTSNKTHVSHEKTSLIANPLSKNMSRVACKIEVVAQHELLQDSEHTSAMVTRWRMYGRIHTQMHPHETSRKTSAKPWVAWSQESRFGTTGNRGMNVCTRTKINRSNVSTMGQQIHEGRLAAGEKSLRKAPPCMHCCQPCRQSRSRRVLFTVANLI